MGRVLGAVTVRGVLAGRLPPRLFGALIVLLIHALAVLALLAARPLTPVRSIVTPLSVTLLSTPSVPLPGWRAGPIIAPQLPAVVPVIAPVNWPLLDEPAPASAASAARGVAEGEGGAGGNTPAALPDRDVSYIANPLPAYPFAALSARQQGQVILRVLVNVQGRAERIDIERSSGFVSLDRAAVDTVRERWRFNPARRAGRLIACWVRFPVNFELRE